MKNLITGANGFVGTWLARRLVAEGHAVRSLVRAGSESALLEGISVERMDGDVTDPESVGRAVEGVDVVFHLAGIRRAATRDAFFRVNAEGTRVVCEAMVRSKTPRLVLCGSLAASGPSQPDRPSEESDPFHPEEWYGESKVKAEQIAFSYADRLQVSVARPPRILGPGDRENLLFFKLVSRGVKVALSGGPRPLMFVDVEDVVDLLLLLATRPEAVGEAFFAAGPISSFEAVQDQVARVLGVKPRTWTLSPAVLRGLGSVADFATRMTGKKLPLNRKLARQLLAPAWTCSPRKAESLLGFRARHTLEDSLTRSAEWYRDQGLL